MTKTILVLAANPVDTCRLRLNKEIREISNGLGRAPGRDDYILHPVLAARQTDVGRAMLALKPNIVHFCGHGSAESGIVFEDESESFRVSAEFQSRVSGTDCVTFAYLPD